MPESMNFPEFDFQNNVRTIRPGDRPIFFLEAIKTIIMGRAFAPRIRGPAPFIRSYPFSPRNRAIIVKSRYTLALLDENSVARNYIIGWLLSFVNII